MHFVKFLTSFLIATAHTSIAGSNIFMKFGFTNNIPGESISKGFEGWIEVQSISFGAFLASSVGGAGEIGTGKPSINSVTLTKFEDSSSVGILNALLAATRVDKVDIRFAKSTGSSTTGPTPANTKHGYLLKNVVVSSFLESLASSDGMLTESISLDFASIQKEYSSMSPTGAVKQSYCVGYSLATLTVSTTCPF